MGDTPEQREANGECRTFPHFSNCPNNGPNGDMFMNYMDVSGDACMNLFTNGQRLRGKAIFATGGPRAAFLDNYFSIIPPPLGIVCAGTVKLFNPNCLTPTWTILSGPATITAGQNTNQVTLQTTGTSGTVSLRATAGNYITEANIDIANSAPVISTTTYTHNGGQQLIAIWNGVDYNPVCNLAFSNINSTIQAASYITWSKVTANPNNVNWAQTNTGIEFYLWAVGQTAVFEVNASNSCGTTIQQYGFRSIDCSGGGGGCRMFTISPNPAKTSFRITKPPSPNLPAPCRVGMFGRGSTRNPEYLIESVKVYDNTGILKIRRNMSKARQAEINTVMLRPGVYSVDIFNGKTTERHQLVITQ